MAKKKYIEEEEETIEYLDDLPENELENFLKENKEFHYNFEDTIYYRVSMGSLALDAETGGGLTPGLHRMVGLNEGGKSSCALEVCKNFLNTIENSRAVLIKAEGRLSPEIQDRSGVKFTFKASEWTNGTCFVFESNVYETVIELMRSLVHKNPHKIKYLFIIDSMDGLSRKSDSEKDVGESDKVAGGAVLASALMKNIATALTKRGHMAIFISQVRADIKLDPYSKAPIRQISATGGNALLHYANFIFEFEARFQKDLILENEKERPDRIKNKIIGHNAKVTIKKSPNEKTNIVIHYPIIYGRTGGKSIWIEAEIVGQLLAYEFVTKKGAWFSVSETLFTELKEQGIEIPQQHQGETNLRVWLEKNPKATDYLYKKLKEIGQTMVELRK